MTGALGRLLGGRSREHVGEVLRGASVALAAKSLAAGLTLAFNLVLARRLGPDGAGLYFLALAAVTGAAILGRLGLDSVLLRHVAAGAATRDWGQVAGASRTALRLTLATSTLVAMGVFGLAPWLAESVFGKPALGTPLRWMSLGIVPLALGILLSEGLKGLKRILASQVVNGVAVPAVSLAVLLLLGGRAGVLGAVAAQVVAALAAAALGLRLWRQAAAPAREAAAAAATASLLGSSLPLLWSALTTFVMSWVGVVALGLWRSEAEVGVFSLAMRTAMLTSLLLISVNTIAAPKFAALHRAGDLAGLEATAAATTWLMVAAAGPLLLLFVVAPGQVMGLFGRDFVAGAAALGVLAVGQFVNAATGSVGHLLLMSGHERLFRNTVLASAVINVALTAALVPGFGVLGAAAANTASLVVKNVAAAWLVVTRVHVRPWRLPGRRAVPAGRAP